jgi:hypothetical protein
MVLSPLRLAGAWHEKHELLVAALIDRQFRLPTGLYHKFLMSCLAGIGANDRVVGLTMMGIF